MSKRVFERNVCGEPLATATNEEPVGRLADHRRSEHRSSEYDEETARPTIAREADDTMDS